MKTYKNYVKVNPVFVVEISGQISEFPTELVRLKYSAKSRGAYGLISQLP